MVREKIGVCLDVKHYSNYDCENPCQSFFQVQYKLWETKGVHNFQKMTTKSRLIIGLGDESVYEASIRLHRNYGVPYIPGSALKGVTKHWAIVKVTEELQDQSKEKDFFVLAKEVQNWFEGQGKSDEIKDSSIKVNDEKVTTEELRNVFGTQEREGLIIIFDAFPDPEKLNTILELDIMNPHYQEYYQGSPKGPGDWLPPNPIIFLTVPTGVTFTFVVVYKLIGILRHILHDPVGRSTTSECNRRTHGCKPTRYVCNYICFL
jgi:CRISPR-associated protein Cmr6